MVSFSNTEIAFKSKSNTELKKAYWLFKIVNNKTNVIIGKHLLNIALFIRLPIKWLIKPTVFRHFCGGETIEECNKTIEKLSQYHIGTILDYSVEGGSSNEAYDLAVNEIINTILKGKDNPHIPFSVFKVSGIARFDLLSIINSNQKLNSEETKEYQLIRNRINIICKTAHENNVPVFIDAEETWIQDTIDNLATEMMLLYNKNKAIVYNTIQLYRTDRLSYLKQMLEFSENHNIFLGFKLVRGAYMEKERERSQKMNYPSPIQLSKKDTDSDFNEAMKFCIKNINKISFCAGTHNEESSLLLADLIETSNISKSNKNIYFAQLLGMSDHITYNLANSGYNVAKYVPYGPIKSVLPYLIRRAEENTSVAGQSSRELNLIKLERKRRKD
jgi:proline dehydrogenase